MKPRLDINCEIDHIEFDKPNHMAPLVIVPNYRTPHEMEQKQEAERISTREARWKIHRIQLASIIVHALLIGANLDIGLTYFEQGHVAKGLLQILIAGGVNLGFLCWTWTRAKRTFS